MEKQIIPFGVDVVHIADDPRLEPYTTLPHAAILNKLFSEEKPQVALMGATPIGRDLGPRVSSALHSGLTADCTSLEIGDHDDRKADKIYKDLLYQIRPAFGGNIIATIINPDCRPQMATVREGVMKKEKIDASYPGKVSHLDVSRYVSDLDFVVQVIERHIQKRNGSTSRGHLLLFPEDMGLARRRILNYCMILLLYWVQKLALHVQQWMQDMRSMTARLARQA